MKGGLLDRAVEGLLGEVGEALEAFTAQWGSPPALPGLGFLVLLAALGVLSLPGLPLGVSLAAVAASLAQMAYSSLRHGAPMGRLLRAAVVVTVFSLVVVSPLIVMRGVGLGFVARVLAASLVASAYTAAAGWRGVLLGLRCLGAPGQLLEAMDAMAVIVPGLALDAVRLLAARRARTLGERGVLASWGLIASAVAALLEKSLDRGLRLQAAARARSLGAAARGGPTPCLGGMGGLAAYAAPLAVLAAYAASAHLLHAAAGVAAP